VDLHTLDVCYYALESVLFAEDNGVITGWETTNSELLSPLTSSVAPSLGAPSVQRFQSGESKSSGAPNGRFSHPVRAQVVVAGSVARSNTAL
jgi:hypothetical protein